MDFKSRFGENNDRQTGGDKRANPRVPVPIIPVKIGEEPEQLSGVMLNLSRSGALIQAPKSLDSQTVLNANFELPNAEVPFNCRSKVVWSRSVYEIHSRLGIRFDAMEPSAADKIGDYVFNQIVSKAERAERAHPRTPTPYISVSLRGGHGHSSGVILDISRSGVLIQTARSIETGSVISAEFVLPGTGRVLNCVARVAWQKKLYGTLANEGLEFIHIDAGSVKFIEDYVRTQTAPRA